MRGRLLALVAAVLILPGWSTPTSAMRGPRSSPASTIRTLPVGPAGMSAAVWPAFAVDGHGAVFFFDGGCGARPESCWCEVLRQRPGARSPTVIAGHAPGSDISRATPAQRLSLAG